MIDAVAAREKYLRLRGLEPVPELADAVARDDYLPVLDALADAQAKIAELETYVAWLVARVGELQRVAFVEGEGADYMNPSLVGAIESLAAAAKNRP